MGANILVPREDMKILVLVSICKGHIIHSGRTNIRVTSELDIRDGGDVLTSSIFGDIIFYNHYFPLSSRPVTDYPQPPPPTNTLPSGGRLL